MNKIYVTKSSLAPYEEYIEEIKDIWDTRILTNNGPKCKKFEQLLKEKINANNVSLFVNGHMALLSALNSLGKKGEIITTPFTFVSTIHAIIQSGNTPIFCDIKETDYTIDENKIEDLITDKTIAILGVHVYGNICNYKKIQNIANKYHLSVVYDAAHAFYEKIDNISTSNLADINMFSFHATKVFNSIEGGMLTYNNEDLTNFYWNHKNFGINGPEKVIDIGFNAKMNEFQAAMGICNLRYIDQEIKKRKKVYDRYIEKLSKIDGIKLNYIPSNQQSNYSYFPIVVEEKYGMSRDELFELLEENNYYGRKYFYPLITDLECYRNIYDSSMTPIAKKISENVITLPMYSDLEMEHIDSICRIIKMKK